jgi:hypothetical protein
MLLLSINRSRGYENPSLEIIVIERCSTRGCPLEEACEHCFLNQSAISVVFLISFLCYCGDYAGYITVILPFLAFYFCSAYFLYLVYYRYHVMFIFPNKNFFFRLYSPYNADVAADRTVCTTIQVTWQRSGMLTGKKLLIGGQITFGHVEYLWVNEMVPRGPVMGCHVAPLH